jgi:hypothetical protein
LESFKLPTNSERKITPSLGSSSICPMTFLTEPYSRSYSKRCGSAPSAVVGVSLVAPLECGVMELNNYEWQRLPSWNLTVATSESAVATFGIGRCHLRNRPLPPLSTMATTTELLTSPTHKGGKHVPSYRACHCRPLSSTNKFIVSAPQGTG